MQWLFRVGVVLAGLGGLGYGLGVIRAYPGRAFALSAIMLGLTLLGIHRLEQAEAA